MSEQAGNLHWNRRRLTLTEGTNDIDTGLTIVNQGYGPLEPPLGVHAAVAPADGTEPASRIQVIPMAPLDNWAGVTIGEPWYNTTDGRIHVNIDNPNEGDIEINVLFWNPHTAISPGQADTYNAPIE
jgi:hypothetical protein